MLLSLAQAAFEKAGWATTVSTGRHALPLGEGENARNVADRKASPLADMSAPSGRL
jgi:hypothetical protein